MKTFLTVFFVLITGISIQAQLVCDLGATIGMNTGQLRPDTESTFTLAGSFSMSTDLNPGAGVLMTPDGVQFGGVALLMDTSFETLSALIYPNTYSSPRRMLRDGDGNLYVIGAISNEIDLDLGSDEMILTADDPSGSGAGFVAKYNSNLDLLWGFKLGDSPGTELLDAAILENGHLLISGIVTDDTDMNPGNGVAMHPANSSFLAQYSGDGEFVESGIFHSLAGILYPIRIEKSQDNHIFTHGYFQGVFDMNPGSGELIFESVNDSNIDGFVIEFNSDMLFLGALAVRGVDEQNVEHVMKDDSGNIFVCGWFKGMTDFDPGSQNTYTTHNGYSSGFIAKYNSSWQFEWVRRATAEFVSGFDGSALFQEDLLITSGSFFENVIIEGLDGNIELQSLDHYEGDGFIAGYSPADGELIWAYAIGSVEGNESTHVTTIIGNTIYFDGYCSVSFDLNPWVNPEYLLEVGDERFLLARYQMTDESICPDSLETTQISNSEFSFLIDGIQPGIEVHWVYGDGTESFGTNLNTHEFEPGIYTIQATFIDPDCSEGTTTFSATIEVFECTLAIQATQNEDGSTTLIANGINTSSFFEWATEQDVTFGGSDTVTYTFEPGWNFPCVSNTSEWCPSTMTACIGFLICAQEESMLTISTNSDVFDGGPSSAEWSIFDLSDIQILWYWAYYNTLFQSATTQICLSDGCYEVDFCGYSEFDIEAYNYEFNLNGQIVTLEDTIQNACGQSGFLSVNSECGLDVWCDASFDLTFEIGDEEVVEFSSNNIYPETEPEWTLDGEIISNESSGSYSFDESGSYTLCLNVTNEYCTNSLCEVLEITLASAISENSDEPILVYPNPANEQLRIQLTSLSSMGELVIFDALAREIFRENKPSPGFLVDTSAMAVGTYTIKYTDLSGVHTRQIVILR